MPTRRTKFNSGVNKEKSPELKKGKRKRKINILLNISLFTVKAKWLCQEVLVNFCSLRWRASYEHAMFIYSYDYENKIYLFLQWCKTDMMVSHPIHRSRMDPLSSPASHQPRCHSLWTPVLIQGLPSCHHMLLQNRGQVCNQPGQEEAARLPT